LCCAPVRAVDGGFFVGSSAVPDDSWRDSALRQRHLTALAQRPATESMRMRRQALERIFSAHPHAAAVVFDERHARVGDFAVHLSTARVTRHGDPINVAMRPQRTAVPMPWLPYDESLLERVAHTIKVLIEQR
jgi:hypothetical protein